jgi:hypothetical protein
MKQVQIYSFLILSFLLNLSLYSQEAKNTQPPASDKRNQAPAKDESLALLKDYNALPALDPSFTVKDITYLRRAAHNGKGDVLDVQINILNNESSSRDYAIYVLAYNEAKNTVFNKLAPPPAWRDNDPNIKNTIVNFSVLAPEKITPKDVWGEAELKKKQDASESKKLKGYENKLGEPSLNEYLIYLSKKPEKALKFKLYAEEVEVGKSTVSNYESSDAELKRDMNLTAVNKHTYTIFNAKYKTTIMTHHYSEFRPDFYFFNKVAVLIFDSKNNLVHRSIQNIGKTKERR